ncbi:MAG TPA: acyltransferase [Chitinophagaceae bacterium]
MHKQSGYFYYKGLDSFRGIGILWIICCHYFPGSNFFRFGWISLEVFFVLSGFLITKVLLNSLNSPNFFRNFYIRRALKIFPLYYLFISLSFIVIFLFTKEKSSLYLKENFEYYYVYLHNFLFVFNGLEPENYLNHLWSLAMEEQFYFLWPIIVFYIRDVSKLRKILIAIVILVIIFRFIVWWNWGGRFEVYHCNTFTRIDTIAFGCILGCGFSYKELNKYLRIFIILICASVFPLAVIIYGNYFFTNPVFCTVGYTAISVLTVFLIEYFISGEKNLLFLKNNWMLNYLGQISYGMYLFHIPVYFFISSRTMIQSPFNEILSLLTSFVIAAASYYFYETPFLKLKGKFSNNRLKTLN